jgi:hypothetical protein
MTAEQAIAFVQAQTACMLVEMEAMKAANRERDTQGKALAYGEDAFMALIDKWGVHHNGALTLLRGF